MNCLKNVIKEKIIHGAKTVALKTKWCLELNGCDIEAFIVSNYI